MGSMEVVVAELSGRTHLITGLLPSDPVRLLLTKAQTSMGIQEEVLGNAALGLVVGDSVLTQYELGKQLQSVGITDGLMVPVVRLQLLEVWEFAGNVGDEDFVDALTTSRTLVRLAFISEERCMLVRETYARRMTGAFTWDICRGTYTIGEDNVATCRWEHCYRRRRTAVEHGHGFSIIDTDWTRRERIPEGWNQVKLQGGVWIKRLAKIHEGFSILGIRLSGRGTCSEALKLLAF